MRRHTRRLRWGGLCGNSLNYGKNETKEPPRYVKYYSGVGQTAPLVLPKKYPMLGLPAAPCVRRDYQLLRLCPPSGLYLVRTQGQRQTTYIRDIKPRGTGDRRARA